MPKSRITNSIINSKIKDLRYTILKILNKRKTGIKILFLAIFFGVIIFSWTTLYNLNDYIPFNVYDYDIDAYGIKALRDVKIYHDFSKNQGKISFELNREDYIESDVDIIIDLPTIVKKESIKIFVKEKDKEAILNKSWKYRLQPVNKKNHTQIDIESIFSKNMDIIGYFITYDTDILPSGHFRIMHRNTPFFGYTLVISLDLGKKYICRGECITKMNNVVPDYPNTDKEIRLELERNEERYHSFMLSGLRDIRTTQGIHLGLLSSALVSFILLFKDLVEEIKYKK